MCSCRDAIGDERVGWFPQHLHELVLRGVHKHLVYRPVLDAESVDGQGVQQLVGENATYQPSQRHARGSDALKSLGQVVWSGVVEGNVAQRSREFWGGCLNCLGYISGENTVSGSGL